MQELLYVVGGYLIAGAVLAVLAVRAGAVLSIVEHWLTYAATAVIFGVMLFVCAEVVMRYVLNAPIPGHLEGSELLVPIIVFFAISYTQSQDGHVGMTLVIEAVPEGVRRVLEMATLLLSSLTCVVLAYFSSKHAWHTYVIDDVTMTPPYWRIWPSAAAIGLGYALLSTRLYLQAVHRAVPAHYPQSDVQPESHLMESAAE